MNTLFLFTLTVLANTPPQYQDGGAHHQPAPAWGYAEDGGKDRLLPEKWNEISPICGEGKRQSPLNIPLRKIKADKSTPIAPKLTLHYKEDAFVVFHNRHTVQATAQGKANSLEYGGVTYALKQFHYHKKSEHLIDGEQYLAEVHFVHEAKPGELLVIGIFADQTGTGDNFVKALKKVLDKYSGKGDRYSPNNLKINPLDFFPEDKNFVNYAGSLTTPPCSEAVTWLVMPSVMKAGEALQAYVKKKKFDVGFKNFRPHFEAGDRVFSLSDQN